MSVNLIKHFHLVKYISKKNRMRYQHYFKYCSKAYYELKKTSRLSLLRRIKGDLANLPLFEKNYASHRFFGAGLPNAELIVRQYLLSRVANGRLIKSLLYQLGSGRPIIYPLPEVWRGVLLKHSFIVSQKCCLVAWIVCIATFWLYGIITILRHILASLTTLITSKFSTYRPYVFFDGLSPGNLPQPCLDGRSYDIVTWYANWSGKSLGNSVFCHNIQGLEDFDFQNTEVKFASGATPPISNLVPLLRFVSWSVVAIFRSAFDALRGRWIHALILAEASTAAKVRLLEDSQLASDYLFNNSGFIYRPLWTYEAAEKGSKILFYFYSTSEQFKLPSGYESIRNEWCVMNWPLYLVFDRYQEEFIRQVTNSSVDIQIVGPIWFQDSATEIPQLPEQSIAVFDIEPHRRYFGFSTMTDLGYGNPDVIIKFLTDIESAIRQFHGTMVHKPKRNIGKRRYPKYAALLNKFSQESKAISINPEISPIRVMENCKAVISSPFTSTAVFAQALGKPSIYYDPIGVIQKDDRGAHGIPIISGSNELEAWIEQVLK